MLNPFSVERNHLVLSLSMFYNIYHHFIACNFLNDYNLPLNISNLQGHCKPLFIFVLFGSMRKNLLFFAI